MLPFIGLWGAAVWIIILFFNTCTGVANFLLAYMIIMGVFSSFLNPGNLIGLVVGIVLLLIKFIVF